MHVIKSMFTTLSIVFESLVSLYKTLYTGSQKSLETTFNILINLLAKFNKLKVLINKMNNCNRYLPPNIRNYIATQAEEGEKYSKISEKVERKFHRTVMKGTISKIFSMFKETGSTEDLPKSGRPNLFTEEEQKDIIKASKKTENSLLLISQEMINSINLKHLHKQFVTC